VRVLAVIVAFHAAVFFLAGAFLFDGSGWMLLPGAVLGRFVWNRTGEWARE
jgi:hypothetical protein